MSPKNNRLAMSDDTFTELIPIKDVFIDMTYARPPTPHKVAAMAKSWKRKSANNIIVSMRADGRFACLDGYHRVCACRSVEGDDAMLPALIYIDLSVEEESDLFTNFNGERTQVNPGQRFKAHLGAKKPEYIAIYRIVQDLGLDLSWDGKRGDGVIHAVSAVEAVARDFGLEMLHDVLKMLRDCFGTDTNSFAISLIKGLTAFLARYGEHGIQKPCDMTRLRTILMTNNPGQFKSLASTIKATNLTLDPGTCVGMAILTKYNEKLRSNHLPPWQGRVFFKPEHRSRLQARARTLRKDSSNGKSA